MSIACGFWSHKLWSLLIWNTLERPLQIWFSVTAVAGVTWGNHTFAVRVKESSETDKGLMNGRFLANQLGLQKIWLFRTSLSGPQWSLDKPPSGHKAQFQAALCLESFLILTSHNNEEKVPVLSPMLSLTSRHIYMRTHLFSDLGNFGVRRDFREHLTWPLHVTEEKLEVWIEKVIFLKVIWMTFTFSFLLLTGWIQLQSCHYTLPSLLRWPWRDDIADNEDVNVKVRWSPTCLLACLFIPVSLRKDIHWGSSTPCFSFLNSN